jgi:hypothetical protein
MGRADHELGMRRHKLFSAGLAIVAIVEGALAVIALLSDQPLLVAAIWLIAASATLAIRGSYNSSLERHGPENWRFSWRAAWRAVRRGR